MATLLLLMLTGSSIADFRPIEDCLYGRNPVSGLGVKMGGMSLLMVWQWLR
ncbi:hypothetical protein [Spirulina subsalsa]|uniref:hypothetical protein n=1 Tax=Spirulina subsalsa TaxID=54311 RepID=UPI0002E0CAD7|nr:hypothetical protein [Spirulina subsalsa]